jgi:serine protease AprX
VNASKLHAALAAALASPLSEQGALDVIVKVRPGPLARGEATALNLVVAKSEFTLLSARAAQVTPAMIEALTEDPAVDLIWPDLPVHTWLDDAVPRIRAPRVWDSGFTGRGVRIAILDTGLDGEHPDFADRVIGFLDVVDPDASNVVDPNGHGTHVTGIAAGTGAASDGRYKGVAPEASLLIARVLDASGSGRTSDVMAGIEWAVAQGAQVLNVSLGGPPYPADGTDALSVLCDAAVEAGVVVCVAAGNMGPGGQTIGSPAAAKRVITVGAAEAMDDGGERVADFSSRGPTGDGRTKPDLCFPGVAIVGPRSSGTRLGTPVDGSYTSMRGTSQATPLAAGTAALLLHANPRATPEDIKKRMIRGARRMPGIDSVVQGAGRGDAYNTFMAAEGAPLGDPERVPPPVRTPEAQGCLGGLVSAVLGGSRNQGRRPDLEEPPPGR